MINKDLKISKITGKKINTNIVTLVYDKILTNVYNSYPNNVGEKALSQDFILQRNPTRLL